MQSPLLFTCACVLFALLLGCSESNSGGTSDTRRPATRAPDEASTAPNNGGNNGDHGDNGGRTPDARPQGAAGRADPESNDTPRDAARPPPRNIKTYVYQGGNGSPYPVRTYALDRATGALTRVGQDVDLGPNPTYLTPSADHKNLYAANEAPEGGVTVASISETGSLTRLGSARVEPGNSALNAMVFTALSPDDKFVLAANYYGPSVSVFARAPDGSLSGPVATQRFDPPAQSHSVRVHPSGKWAFVPNKDADAIAQLRFDPASGALTPNTPAQYTTPRGAGPRHIAFSPDGAFAYVSNENDNTVSAYRVTAQGLLEVIDTESLLPPDYSGRSTAAHVLVHPNGKHVYVSVRGTDQITVFQVDADGGLTPVQQVSTRGRTPRNFDIDDLGEFMVVANQGSGSLAVFRIQEDGTLSALGDVVTGLQEPNAVAIVNLEE